MFLKIAADSVVIIHLGFILFVILGGVFIYRCRWLIVLHLPAVIWGSLIEFYGWICPLTPLEKKFRRLAGDVGYGGGFIDQYIMPIIYPAGLTREIQIVLGVAVVLINIVAYAFFLVRLFKGSLKNNFTF